MTELWLPVMYDIGLSYSYSNYFNWITCLIGTTYVIFGYHLRCLLKFSTMPQHWNTKYYCVCRGTEAELQGIHKTFVKQMFIVEGMAAISNFLASNKQILYETWGRKTLPSREAILFCYSETWRRIFNHWPWEKMKQRKLLNS